VKQLLRFAAQFGAKISLNPESIVERGNRYYLLNAQLRKFTGSRDYFYAGLYLGKMKNGVFFPSFNLLDMLVPAAANKVILERKAAWLFICGRDVFASGIIKVMGAKRKGEATLVLNEFGDCLGFGRILGGLETEAGQAQVALRNVVDVGDFLRRERGMF
jgi:ribosome biogenesis protein Nip4